MHKNFAKVENSKDWQNLLDKVLFKTFFHYIEWEEFLERQFKWLRFERYFYKDSALLSLARVGNKLISHPFCEYGGPLPLVEKIDGGEFRKDLFEEFKIPFKISFHPKLLDYFEGMEFPENQRETYFFEDLHVQNASQVWDKLNRNRRRSIKEAQSYGFEIERCRNLEDLKKLHTLYVKSLKEHKAIPYPFSFFRFLSESPKNAEILLMKKGKKLAGGNIFLYYGKIVHSFLCGFDKKYKNLGAHSLLLWSAINNAREKGLQAFDFGATRKDSSIRDFKERWGAEALPIYELKNYSGESSLRKSKLRDAYALLPAFLIKKLSSHLLKYKL